MSSGVKVWLAILALAALIYGGYLLLQSKGAPDQEASVVADESTEEEGPKIVPGEEPVDLTQFTMVERSGEEYNFEQLLGEVWVANTFFSSCPHSCRDLTKSVSALHNQPELADVRFVSISVDPVADTPEELADYADTFSADKDRWLFMNGKLKVVRQLGKEMGLKMGPKVHTDHLVVFDHTGRYRDAFLFTSEQEIAEMRKLLVELLKEKRKATTESQATEA